MSGPEPPVLSARSTSNSRSDNPPETRLPAEEHRTIRGTALCNDRVCGTWFRVDDLDVVYDRDIPEAAHRMKATYDTFDGNDPAGIFGASEYKSRLEWFRVSTDPNAEEEAWFSLAEHSTGGAAPQFR